MVALDKENWNRNYVNIDVYLYEIPRQRPSGLHLHHAEVAQDTHRGIFMPVGIIINFPFVCERGGIFRLSKFTHSGWTHNSNDVRIDPLIDIEIAPCLSIPEGMLYPWEDIGSHWQWSDSVLSCPEKFMPTGIKLRSSYLWVNGMLFLLDNKWCIFKLLRRNYAHGHTPCTEWGNIFNLNNLCPVA